MMAFALMPSGSIDSDIEDATREELPARPQSISDRRRISSTAASLLDDEEEEKTGPGLIYESDDSNSSCKFPDGKNGYSKEDHALQTKEFMSINGIAEGMTSLFCSPSLEETDRTDSAVTLIDPQNASELDMSNLHSSTGMGGISRISSPEPLNNSQRSLSMVDEANQHLVGCTDMDLEGVREIIAKDVSAVLGTSGAAVQWVVDLNAWLMGMNERPYKMTGSSRRKLRNRCGIRGAQAQRLQRLWSNWHSNTGEAMSSPQTYEGRPKNASENPNMPPQPIWSISVTRSLDDAELVSSSAVPIKNRWSESVDKPVSDIQCVTSAPSIAPPPPDVAVQPDLYYDSDPEIFRQASRTSPKAASSPTNKPIRRRRQISISGASDNTTSVEGQSKRLRRQIPIPDAIDTVASVGSRDFGAPPAPRNFLGKGAPSFDMMPSFDNCVNMPDEDVVHEFIKDLALQKTNLIWHSSMEGSASDKDSAAPTKCRSPVSVQAWFELGSRLPSALVQPKFMWRETYQPDLLNHKRLGTTFRKPDALDILSMIRIVKPTSIDRTLYPFVKLDQSFTILTHTNEVHVFEAPSPQERDWLVHGLKLAVARLASMIIVGDDQMFVEFFSPWAYTPVVEDTPEPSINIQLQDEERDGTPNGVFISTTDRERGGPVGATTLEHEELVAKWIRTYVHTSTELDREDRYGMKQRPDRWWIVQSLLLNFLSTGCHRASASNPILAFKIGNILISPLFLTFRSKLSQPSRRCKAFACFCSLLLRNLWLLSRACILPMSSGLATSFGMLQAVAKREFDTGDLNPTDESPMTPRCRVLHMGVLVGSLCSAMLTNAPFDEKREPLEQMTGSETVQDFSSSTAASTFWTSPEHESARDKVAQAMGTLFWALVVTAGACSLDLRECIVKKLELNGRKYPVELCKGKSGKYTAYSDRTGITKTEGQSTIGADSTMSSVETIEEMIRTIRRFATDRQWTRFHSPRSILLALMGELGELAELFQWKGDDHELVGLEGWKKEEVDKVGQELADVSIYLLRLADVCCIYNIGPLTLKAGGYTSSNH